MWLSTSACAQGQQHQQSAREQARAQQQSLVKVCCSCSVGCNVYIDYALLVAACWDSLLGCQQQDVPGCACPAFRDCNQARASTKLALLMGDEGRLSPSSIAYPPGVQGRTLSCMQHAVSSLWAATRHAHHGTERLSAMETQGLHCTLSCTLAQALPSATQQCMLSWLCAPKQGHGQHGAITDKLNYLLQLWHVPRRGTVPHAEQLLANPCRDCKLTC